MERLFYFLSLIAPTPDQAPLPDFGHRRDFYCAALAVYAEARGEGPLGQLHVASVIRNRVNRDMVPRSACDVVEEPDQFVGIERWPVPRRPWQSDPVNWTTSQLAVEAIFSGLYQDECTVAMGFFSPPPGGVAVVHRARVVCFSGGHVFISPEE